MISVIENFSSRIDEVRESALSSGFGTWSPNKGEVGSSIYEGMNFWGKHSILIGALTAFIGRPIYPNNMFFRVTNVDTEAAYVHSDREAGDVTCIVYLSDHPDEKTGTGFYRHRETGMTRMPSFSEMSQDKAAFNKLKCEMVSGSDQHWEQLDFIRGLYNRAVIFDAPLFHARSPRHGIGSTYDEGRMVWVCHFVTQFGSSVHG